jgi:hypothetical protein
MFHFVAEHRDPDDGAGVRRGLAVPCFADDPADLAELGAGAERAGLAGQLLAAGRSLFVLTHPQR